MIHFHKNIMGNRNNNNSNAKRNKDAKDKKNREKQISSAQLHYVRAKRKEHFLIVSAQFLILTIFINL